MSAVAVADDDDNDVGLVVVDDVSGETIATADAPVMVAFVVVVSCCFCWLLFLFFPVVQANVSSIRCPLYLDLEY